jgi:hypothetical protein
MKDTYRSTPHCSFRAGGTRYQKNRVTTSDSLPEDGLLSTILLISIILGLLLDEIQVLVGELVGRGALELAR